MSPTWLLDVDGVLNANRPGWGGAPARKFVADDRGESWKICWAPPLLRRIRALLADDLVRIVWSTTWCGHTAGLEHVFGLPTLECAFTVSDRRFVSHAKLDAALRVVAEGRPLIWTDDVEVPVSGPLFDELTSNGRGLLIRPSSRRGLQPDHMDRIDAFVRAKASGLTEVPVSR